VNVNAADLLKLLGSGVRPDASTLASGAPTVESASFEALLQQVRSGAVGSGRPIAIAPGAGVNLNSSQLERLAVATDAAEAAGALRLLAMIDGQAVAIDVAERQVISGASSLGSRVHTDFDAVVFVPDGSAQDLKSLFASGAARIADAAYEAVAPGLESIRNSSLAALLESILHGGEPSPSTIQAQSQDQSAAEEQRVAA